MSAKDEEREYGWYDENGDYFYMNRFMGFRFLSGTDIPEEYRDKPDAPKAARDIVTGLLKETEKFDTELVESLTLKQIAERTEKSEIGKLRYVRLGRTAYNPKFLKTIRRTFKDAMWYVRPDKGELSNLYIVDPYNKQTIGVLMPMKILG